MTELFFDTETFSTTPLSNGAHRYAETGEVMVVSWAFDDEPAQVCDITLGNGMPRDVVDALRDPAVRVIMHNGGNFDRTVMRVAHGLVIPPERIHDTMVQALSHGLPGSLEKLGEIFGVAQEDAKLKTGKALIQLFCKPRPKTYALRRATRLTHPAEWEEFLLYAKQDIPSMRHVYRHCPRWNYPGVPGANKPMSEFELWCLDQRINDRGFKVDTDLARAAIAAVDKASAEHHDRTFEMTDGDIDRATQRDKMLAHLLDEYGVGLPDMTKSTLERRLADPDLPDAVRELIAIRLDVTTTSTAKYAKLLSSVSADGRLRGTLQFCGAARTRRDAGRIFQPQNLPRPTMAHADIDQGIAALKSGSAHLLFDNPIKLASNALRGSIIADEGRKLVVADLAQIEARVLPWLAGAEWKLQAFRNYDAGTGPDLYKIGAGRVLGIDPADVTKDQRQGQGKVPELACLGPRTQVLTSNGTKTITAVTLEDLLWDGQQWVRHAGIVDRGWKETISLSGLQLTPDHLILSDSQWLSASTVATNPSILQCCLMKGTDSLPSSVTFEGRTAALKVSRCGATVAPNHTPLTSITCGTEEPPVALHVRENRSDQRVRNGGSTKPLSLIRSTAGGFVDACRLASIGAITRTTKTSAITAGAVSKSGRLGEKIAAYLSRTSSRLMGGMILCLKWTGSTSTEIMSRSTLDLSRSERTPETSAPSTIWNSVSPNWNNTYDIAHAGPRNRFTVLTDDGALIVHNCGYGGSVGAFHSMALIYGVTVTDAEAKTIVDAWRKANPEIANWDDGFWSKLDTGARSAIGNPGRTFEAGPYIRFEKWRSWLRMELPSGGIVSFADAQIVDDPKWAGKTTIAYMGLNPYTRQWSKRYTYGGKIAADATQSTARDYLFSSLPSIEAAGFPILTRIHDELLTEPLDDPKYSVDKLVSLMTARHSWIDDKLPVSASGFEAYRYRKDD